MPKVFTAALLTLTVLFYSSAQSSDPTIVTITGKMYKAQDSTLISGNILYEKLPYYDDMGMASVSQDGAFQLHLVKGETYNLSVSKPGFRKYEGKIEVGDVQNMDIFIEEDIVELRKLENLNFVTNSDQINSGSYSELDELAQYLNENPTLVIQLEGHTDFGGNAQSALRLSQARVEAVKNYLIEKRVKKNRIFTKAFGGTKPLVMEGTREERAVNRRVEVRFIRR
ncbi:MAG: OmpA family protein [Bacteroidota bacterium]